MATTDTELSPELTEADVRQRLQDYEDVNAPLFTQNLSDTDLLGAIQDTIYDFNESPPMLFRQYNSVDFPFKRMLLDGAVVACLRLIALKELRGEMQYNDGGIASTISYKYPQFNALRQELEQKYEMDKLRRKKHLNIQACYGGAS